MKAVGVEIAQLIVEIDEIQQIVAEHRRRRERHQDLPSDGMLGFFFLYNFVILLFSCIAASFEDP